MLKAQNPHERDAHISFHEPTHTYTVRGRSDYTSVTTWNHAHFEPFDEPRIIAKILASPRAAADPSYKYFGQSATQISAAWEDNRASASAAGTAMHLAIEQFYNHELARADLEQKAHDGHPEFAYFLNFVDDFRKQFPRVRPFRTEWTVFFEQVRIAGSIDMLFEDPDDDDGALWIYDWKRCKDIAYEARTCAKTPCLAHLPDTNFWHYALQLNVYRHILETQYHKRVAKMCLVKLHPNNALKSYELFEVPPLLQEMDDLFALRLKQVQSEPTTPLP